MTWMKWRDRATGAEAPEAKHGRAGPLIALTSAGRARWTPRDYASLASEGFTKNPVVYRCVRMIAEAAASTPFVVFEDGVRADGHPLARLLAKPMPNRPGRSGWRGSMQRCRRRGTPMSKPWGMRRLKSCGACAPTV